MARKVGLRAGPALLVGLLAALCLTGLASAQSMGEYQSLVCPNLKKRACKMDVNCFFSGGCTVAGKTGPERCAAVQKARNFKKMKSLCESQTAPSGGKCECSVQNPRKPRKCGVCNFVVSRVTPAPTPAPTPTPAPDSAPAPTPNPTPVPTIDNFIPISPTPASDGGFGDSD